MSRLWLNAHDYGARLLRGAVEPWDDASSLGPFYGELAALLMPWRLVVPVEPILRQDLPRTGDDIGFADALDALVNSAHFTQRLGAGLATLAHSRAAGLCSTMLPGPSRLFEGLQDEDALDDVVAALGHILRQLSGASLSGSLMIDEPDPELWDALSPLHRIAEHAGVTLMLLGDTLDKADWKAIGEGGMSAPGKDLYCVIPPDSEPESVLAKIAQARSTGGGHDGYPSFP